MGRGSALLGHDGLEPARTYDLDYFRFSFTVWFFIVLETKLAMYHYIFRVSNCYKLKNCSNVRISYYQNKLQNKVTTNCTVLDSSNPLVKSYATNFSTNFFENVSL